MKKHIARPLFPLLSGEEHDAVCVQTSTSVNRRHPKISETEMEFVWGKNYREQFTTSAASLRAQAEGETDGRTKSGLEDGAAMREDIAQNGLRNYRSAIAIKLERARYVPIADALTMTSEPSEQQIQEEVSAMKKNPVIAKAMERNFQKHGKTTDQDQAAAYEANALVRLLNAGVSALIGLPPDIVGEIRNDRLEVYIVDESEEFRHTNIRPRYIDFEYFDRLRQNPDQPYTIRAERSNKIQLIRTGRLAGVSGEGFITYIERQSKPRTGRGLMIIIRPSIVKRATRARHNITYHLIPTLLHRDLFPRYLPEERVEYALAIDEERGDRSLQTSTVPPALVENDSQPETEKEKPEESNEDDDLGDEDEEETDEDEPDEEEDEDEDEESEP